MATNPETPSAGTINWRFLDEFARLEEEFMTLTPVASIPGMPHTEDIVRRHSAAEADAPTEPSGPTPA